MTRLWGLVAAAALLWPDRIHSPFDGVPLDRTAEAILIGLVFPGTVGISPAVPGDAPRARRIIALIVWKAFGTSTFVQDGWCVRFQPERPFAKDADRTARLGSPRRLAHARSRVFGDHDALVSRRLGVPGVVLQPAAANDSWPIPEDYPPKARVGMRVRGFLTTTTDGTLEIEVGPDINYGVAVDGRLAAPRVQLTRGVHQVVVEGTLTGKRWAFVPRWNGEEIWAANVAATMQRPSRRLSACAPGPAGFPCA